MSKKAQEDARRTLRQRAQKAEAECRRLNEEIERRDSEITGLRSQLKKFTHYSPEGNRENTLEHQIAELKKQLELSKQEVATLKAEAESNNSLIKTLKSELEEKRRIIAEQADKLLGLRDQYEEFFSELKQQSLNSMTRCARAYFWRRGKILQSLVQWILQHMPKSVEVR